MKFFCSTKTENEQDVHSSFCNCGNVIFNYQLSSLHYLNVCRMSKKSKTMMEDMKMALRSRIKIPVLIKVYLLANPTFLIESK